MERYPNGVGQLLPALIVLGLGACSEAEPRREAASHSEDSNSALLGKSSLASRPLPNLLLVVFDTVRADHVSCYGYPRATTPALDAFAKGATRYTRAFSSAPWTLPSHASMFTGLDPDQHGVQTIVSADYRVGVRPLHEQSFTLAEGLSELGYRTGAFIANASYLQPAYGLAQGFDTYHVKQEVGLLVNRKAQRWLAEPGEGPWFLFVNYLDAHRPYVSRPRPEIVPEPVDRNGTVLLDRLIETVMPGGVEPDPELVQAVIDQYDLGLASADQALGRLLERISESVAERETWVVITSDHGEYFGEHDLVEHSKDVYQPAHWIPLVIGRLESSSEDSGGLVEERPVVSADLPELLFGHVDHPELNTLAERFRRGGPDRVLRIANAYAREKDVLDPTWGHRFRRFRDAVIDWPWKLIHSSDDQHELYHLELDPEELDNRYEAEPEIAQRLTQLLDRPRRAGSVPDAEIPEMSPEERERMRKLGYVE